MKNRYGQLPKVIGTLKCEPKEMMFYQDISKEKIRIQFANKNHTTTTVLFRANRNSIN